MKESIGTHLVPYLDGGYFNHVLDLTLQYEKRDEIYARENPIGDYIFMAPERQVIV